MYSVSKEMPLSSYQILNPSDSQADFKPGQIIRFTIPRSAGFWDAHLSKLQLQVETTGANYKMCFSSPKAGVASCIDMIRLTQNGRVISEIQEYGTLKHILKDYGSSLSQEQTSALYDGCVDYISTVNTKSFATSNAVLFGQGLNRTGATSMVEAEKPVKFQMYLDCVSLFERLQVVPSAFIGDLLLEIRLAQDAKSIMKVLPATGQTFSLSTAFANAATEVKLKPPFIGFTCLADSPFVVGMGVTPDGSGNEYDITALSQDSGTGEITITLNPAIAAGDDGINAMTITAGADGAAAATDPEFTVLKSELQLQIVKPPDSYVADMASQVESEGMFFDVPSVTTYRATVLSGIKEQTITIPTTQSRAVGFLSVPRDANQAVTYNPSGQFDYHMEGVFAGLAQYRSQINGIYYPNQPVDLSVMNGGWHFSQEHLRELEKTFSAIDKPFKSVNSLLQDFVIGRALSVKGSSTDLTATPINLYLQYTGAGPDDANPKDMLSYLFHITRVGITPAGIEVMN